MHAYSIKYRFSQGFNLSAKEAFDWCTDYKPYDLSLMNESGKRRIRKVTDDLILLTETTQRNRKTIRKTKLVRLNNSDLSWINTHITGPTRHSEFIYKIEPKGKNRSRLYFTGLLICYSQKPLSRRARSKIGQDERKADSRAWHYLAAAMGKEVRSSR